jgi:hypothetical protein
MSLPGVLGVAEGEFGSKPCIKVYVIRKTPELLRRLPSNLEGYVVVVEESDKLQALDQ